MEGGDEGGVEVCDLASEGLARQPFDWWVPPHDYGLVQLGLLVDELVPCGHHQHGYRADKAKPA
eukprot:7995083-Pyramimonas_sp.AAC.1